MSTFAGMSSTQQEWLERLRAVHSKNGAADSKKHGQHAGPDGFAARQGTLDSKVLGKRAGPGGFGRLMRGEGRLLEQIADPVG